MIAAGLDAAGTDVALCRASRRKSCTVSVPNLAAANLDADNDEAASPFAGEFRVGLMSLPARGGNDRAAGLDIGTGVGLAKPRKGRHESGIEGELGPVPKGERRPFATTSMRRARVCDRHIDIHVCKPDGARVGRTPEVAQAKGRAALDSCTCAARAGGEAAGGEHETGRWAW